MNFIRQIFSWLGRAMSEDSGAPSSMRLVITVGSLAIILGLVGMWCAACMWAKQLVDVPASVGATLGSYLLTLLGAKVIQKGKEGGP